MNLCRNCGTQLNGQRFCPNCGAKADMGSVTQPPKKNSKKILFVIIALVLIIAVAGAVAVVAFKTDIVKLPVASVESDYTATEGKSFDYSVFDLIDDYIVCVKNCDAEKMVNLLPEELINYYVEKSYGIYDSKESYIEHIKSLMESHKENLNSVGITEPYVGYDFDSMESLSIYIDNVHVHDEWSPIYELFANKGMKLEEAKEIRVFAYPKNLRDQEHSEQPYVIKVIKIDNTWYLYEDWMFIS